MTPPAPPPLYVVAWRAPHSARLRTYLDPSTRRPLALPLTEFSPPPAAPVITTPLPARSLVVHLAAPVSHS